MECVEGDGLASVATWKEVVRVRIHLLSLSSTFRAFNEEYKKYLPDGGRNPPCRATVGTEVGRGSPTGPHARISLLRLLGGPSAPPLSVMHVQSISLWAPANIGPYSQAVRCGGTVFLAGMIGLDPGSMELVPGGAGAEAERAMRSCTAVAQAMEAGRWEGGVVYVTDAGFAAAVLERLPAELRGLCCVAVVDQLPRDAKVELLLVATGASAARDSEPAAGVAGVSMISRWKDRGMSYTLGHGVVVAETGNEGDDDRGAVARSLAQNGIFLDSHMELVIHSNRTYDFTRVSLIEL